MARPHARPAAGPVRRRPAYLHLPRARHRRRLLPQAPAPQPGFHLLARTHRQLMPPGGPVTGLRHRAGSRMSADRDFGKEAAPPPLTFKEAAALRPGMRRARTRRAIQLDGSRRTPQDDTAAARWSLGRGNALVPWSWQMTAMSMAGSVHGLLRAATLDCAWRDPAPA